MFIINIFVIIRYLNRLKIITTDTSKTNVFLNLSLFVGNTNTHIIRSKNKKKKDSDCSVIQ